MTNTKHLEILNYLDNDLILRAERAQIKRPSRRHLKLISVAAAVLALSVLAIAIVPGLINKPEQPPIITDDPTDTPIVTETPETSIWENPDIVWGSGFNYDTGEYHWHGLEVTPELLNVLEKYEGSRNLIAVSFYIRADSEFSYDGKTLYYYSEIEQASALEVYKIKSIIHNAAYWEEALNDPERYQMFVRKFGENVYNRCFEKDSHAFIAEEAELILEEALCRYYIACDETNAVLRKYYDTVYPLSDFTDKLDSLNIPYFFADRGTSNLPDESDDPLSVPQVQNEPYIPGGKDLVFCVTAEKFSKLNDIIENKRNIIFINYMQIFADY